MTVPERIASEPTDRLDRVLPRLFPDLSRGAARRLIAAGSIFLNGQRCRVASRTVRAGDRVRLAASTPLPAAAPDLVVLYEGDGLVAVDKPSRMPSAPTRAAATGTVLEVLQDQLGVGGQRGRRLWLVHRLDAGTSGVLLFATTRRAAAALSDAFRHQQVVKRYLVLVEPAPVEEAGTIEASLRAARGRAIVDPCGRPARTEWRIVGRSGHRALLGVMPRTGRMHQIRAHLAAIGSPVVGDPLYGGVSAARLMLHAAALELTWAGRALRIEAPLPAGFADDRSC